MWNVAVFLVCVVQLSLATTTNAEGYYSIIAPGTIHPGHEYHVAVAVHNTDEPCQLMVGIIGPSSYNATKLVDLAHGLRLVAFDVPELGWGAYNLTVHGVAGLKFYNTTKLDYAGFDPHVLIQTDKATYKPGDNVMFRVIFLDKNLRPAHISNASIVWFEDSKRNRVKEFKDLDVVKGVYTGSFQLSEYTDLGMWRIFVKTNTGVRPSQQAIFHVEKYVLPKYLVTVEATERVSVQDDDVHVVVRANYTYGKPVNGKVLMLLEVRSYYYFHNNDENERNIPPIIRTADMINGKAKIDFNVRDYQSKISRDYPTHAIITVTVEEDFTGVKLNGTGSTTLFPYRYQMNCRTFDTCHTFHANKESEVVYEVRRVDGSLVKDTKSIVRLTYTETYQEYYHWAYVHSNVSTTTTPPPPPEKMQKITFESHLNDSSMAVFKIKLPELEDIANYHHFFNGTLEFDGQTTVIIPTYQYREPKDVIPVRPQEPADYFRIEVKYEDDKYSLEMDKETAVTINSSKPLDYFVYMIVGRGDILKAEHIKLPSPKNVYTFSLLPTFEMAPYGKIYVHYIEEGNLQFSETTFYINWKSQNNISISAPKEVKVGDAVDLNISTAPNSFVGLLGVDQSVLLLREGNDLDENQFRWRLGQYSTHTPYQGGYSRYPGQVSGVLTLSNAHYVYNRTLRWSSRPMMDVQADVLSTTNKIIGDSGSHSLVPQAAFGSAGVEAMSSGAEAPAIRKDFAETWIFDSIENTSGGNFTFTKKIPDTITSWVVTGFSLHEEKGIATTNTKSIIKSFQPFFVSIRLPYSVKRNEVLSVPALVFNYLDKNLDVEVTLDNTDKEFEFVDPSNEVTEADMRSKKVVVSSNSASGVSFLLRPKVVGNILLKFTAKSALAGDTIHKPLKVVPEGVTEYVNRGFLVNLKDTSDFKDSIELQVPADIVPDSERAQFSVVGDLLGPLLDNLDALVRLPTGCGEQTMSKFVPNYLVLQYLKNINRLTPSLQERIQVNLERGYQNMLHFRHSDGSFSSFGPSDKDDERPRNGSTWLTAYVMRFFQRASDVVNIDPNVVQSGLSYLVKRQAANGSFLESQDFFYGSQRNQISLTASTLLALLERNTPEDAAAVKNGLTYIHENVNKDKDLRARALGAYALQVANHPEANNVLSSLKSLAKSDASRMWWSSEEGNRNNGRWLYWPRSNEVETTSYMLLSLLEHESVADVLPIVVWLVAQRNSYGGFASTQDTVVGLQALIKFAEKSNYAAAEMTVAFQAKGSNHEKSDSITINKDNAVVLQTYKLPSKTRYIDLQAHGKGAAFMQLSYEYNVYEKEKSPTFTIDTTILAKTQAAALFMEVRVDYVGANDQSNMAVLEVSLPSGYVAEEDSLADIKKVDRIRHVETKHFGTTIIIYFESLRKDDAKLVLIEGFKQHHVAMLKPVPVVIYDYYDTDRRATAYYEVSSKLCDICDKTEEDCQKACGHPA